MSQARSRPELRDLLGDVIGSGPKSAEDLSYEQARGAFERLLAEEFDPTTLGAFLLANRWKSNTPEELAAYVDVMRERSVQSVAPSVAPVDCGANYDGKRDTAILGVGAGLVAAAAGVPVVVHSGDRVPTLGASAYKHVLDALDVPTDLRPTESAAMTDAVGLGFYYQPRFNRGIHDLLPYRERMGVRTFFNTVETLANPADATVHLGSFYHLAFAKRLIETADVSDSLELERVIMFQGIEGYDDVRPGYTKVAEWHDGELDDYEIETAAYGMDWETEDLRVRDVPADSARITEEVLTGLRRDRFADAIALNAAFRLYAGGAADTLDAGLELATRTIATGEAEAALERLQAFDPAE